MWFWGNRKLCWRSLWDTVSTSLEAIFTSGISNSPPLAIRIDVRISSYPVTSCVTLLFELHPILLLVSSPKRTISRQVPLLLQNSNILIVIVILTLRGNRSQNGQSYKLKQKRKRLKNRKLNYPSIHALQEFDYTNYNMWNKFRLGRNLKLPLLLTFTLVAETNEWYSRFCTCRLVVELLGTAYSDGKL